MSYSTFGCCSTLSCHFWLQKTKMATAKMTNSRLQNRSPQTNGWRHGDYVHFYIQSMVETNGIWGWEPQTGSQNVLRDGLTCWFFFFSLDLLTVTKYIAFCLMSVILKMPECSDQMCLRYRDCHKNTKRQIISPTLRPTSVILKKAVIILQSLVKKSEQMEKLSNWWTNSSWVTHTPHFIVWDEIQKYD